jgi:PAT family beta-lactamase induction signal transducer AmpG
VGLLAMSALTPYAVPASVAIFVLIAMASATQDIAIDGFYLDVLDKGQQAYYVGIRSAAYKVSWLLGSGGLVYLAGYLAKSAGIAWGWMVAYAISGVLFLAAWVFHGWYLPHSPATVVQSRSVAAASLPEIFSSYFRQAQIAAVVFYILTFRLGDALMLKMAPPFLLDPLSQGGLGLTTADVGLSYGTVGTLFLLLGGILGGWLIGRDGLRRWLWPTALIQNSAILLYWYLAVCKPGIWMVAIVNSIEQFSYGLGVAAYTVFLLSTVKTEYKAAHYAMATALMAAGVMIPGAVSGYLQQALGYANFFLLSFLAAIPGILVIFLLPLSQSAENHRG